MQTKVCFVYIKHVEKNIVIKKGNKIMKKTFKKLIAMGLTAIMAVSAMSISAFATADKETKTVDPNVEVIAIDEDGNETVIPMFYDEKAAQLSEQRAMQRAVRPIWEWNRGYYTSSIANASYFNILPVFMPVNSRIGIDSILYGYRTNDVAAPSVAVNDYTKEQAGEYAYVGSFNYSNTSGNTYEISYTIRGLTNSHCFDFTVLGFATWNNGSISIKDN